VQPLAQAAAAAVVCRGRAHNNFHFLLPLSLLLMLMLNKGDVAFLRTSLHSQQNLFIGPPILVPNKVNLKSFLHFVFVAL
jgi:hypothetical protein